MKTKFKNTLLLTFFALLALTSCQNEITEITQPDEEQVIVPQSTLSDLMVSASTNNGTVDNILDNADCLSVNLPVTIVVNGITITINTLEDLELIYDIFEEFVDDEDELELIFPITIILNDYTEVVIENQEQMDEFIDRCSEVEEVIECVDFVYPISFSIYDTSFQVIETIVIENDEELYDFMERIEDAEEAILASLNFPVKLEYSNGEHVEVYNNNELEAAIQRAEEMCDDEVDCDIDEVDEYLMECYWKIYTYNDDDHLRPFHLAFMEDGQLKIIKPNGDVIIYGGWNTAVTDAGIVLTITESNTFDENLSGEWLLVECDDDRFKFVRTNAAGSDTTRMVLKQRCEEEPDCGPQEIRRNLKECFWHYGSNIYSNNNPGIFNFLDDGTVKISPYPGTNEEVIGYWEVALTDYGIKLILELPEPYSDLSGYWRVYECEDGRIKVVRDDYYIVFERECVNPFDCFDHTEVVICDDGDVYDGIATFNLNTVYEECPQDNVEITFHTSEADAHDNVNALPAEYTNTNNQEVLYARVTLAGANTYQLFVVVLYVEDCSEDCTEEQVDAFLMEANCHWVAVAYNGDDHLINYDIYFNENQDLVIKDENANEIVGTWSTNAGTGNGVVVGISQLDGDLGAAFNMDWTVVECGVDRFVLVSDNIELVIERECQ